MQNIRNIDHFLEEKSVNTKYRESTLFGVFSKLTNTVLKNHYFLAFFPSDNVAFFKIPIKATEREKWVTIFQNHFQSAGGPIVRLS